MRNEPNLKDWAEALIHGITGDEGYNPKLVKWVEAELTDIAKKFYDIGLNQGWAIEQDKAGCKYEPSGLMFLGGLNIHKCVKCGENYEDNMVQ